MLYMIVGQIAPDSSARREAARPEHLQRLHVLLDQGRLVLAGPCPAIDSPDPGPAGYPEYTLRHHKVEVFCLLEWCPC